RRRCAAARAARRKSAMNEAKTEAAAQSQVVPNWLREERDVYVLGLLRVVFATLMFFLVVKEWREYRVDFFGESFHMPLLPEALVPSRTAYLALMGFQAVCCGAALSGFLARPALALAALGGLYGMLGDRLHYHNNRYELLLLTLLVAVTPCDRSWLLVG